MNSPTPWKVVEQDHYWYVEDAEENVILDGPLEDDAQLTVDAVNSYEANQQTIRELRDALETSNVALKTVATNHHWVHLAELWQPIIDANDSALAKLTPEVKP